VGEGIAHSIHPRHHGGSGISTTLAHSMSSLEGCTSSVGRGSSIGLSSPALTVHVVWRLSEHEGLVDGRVGNCSALDQIYCCKLSSFTRLCTFARQNQPSAKRASEGALNRVCSHMSIGTEG
jgi:hypothetical protein